MDMAFRASSEVAERASPLTETSISLPESLSVVAVVPVSSLRTAAPIVEAVRPKRAAFCRLMETLTCGVRSEAELSTSTASGRAEMRSTSWSAIPDRRS